MYVLPILFVSMCDISDILFIFKNSLTKMYVFKNGGLFQGFVTPLIKTSDKGNSTAEIAEPD